MSQSSRSYIWPLLHLNDGESIVIKGSLPCGGVRFDINFQTDSNIDAGDIVFHMSNRYGTDYDQIVLNTRKTNVGWMTEDIHNKAGVLTPGSVFNITIALVGDQFSVAVNGHHFANFKVRLPIRCIKYFSVIGEVELSSLAHAQTGYR
ncbi:putative lectin, galactoside-binding, soluble, 9 (galectin 9)-like 1 [Trypoxylus dichotomus]